MSVSLKVFIMYLAYMIIDGIMSVSLKAFIIYLTCMIIVGIIFGIYIICKKLTLRIILLTSMKYLKEHIKELIKYAIEICKISLHILKSIPHKTLLSSLFNLLKCEVLILMGLLIVYCYLNSIFNFYVFTSFGFSILVSAIFIQLYKHITLPFIIIFKIVLLIYICYVTYIFNIEEILVSLLSKFNNTFYNYKPHYIFIIIIMGSILFCVKQSLPLIYSIVEICIGSLICKFVLNDLTILTEMSSNTSHSFKFIGGLYIIVRGLSNIYKCISINSPTEITVYFVNKYILYFFGQCWKMLSLDELKL